MRCLCNFSVATYCWEAIALSYTQLLLFLCLKIRYKSKSRVSSYCLELERWRPSTQVLRHSAKMIRSTHSIYEFLVFFLAIRQLQNDEFPLHCRLLLGPSEVQNLCIITNRILIFLREFHDLLYKSVLRAKIKYML